MGEGEGDGVEGRVRLKLNWSQDMVDGSLAAGVLWGTLGATGKLLN